MSKHKQPLTRREFNKLGVFAAATTALGAVSSATAQTPASALESAYLMELSLDVDQQMDTGHVRIAPVSGGTFSGPRLKGTVYSGGADWVTQVSGHSSLDVRIGLETDDGAFISMSYKGIIARNGSDRYWRVTPLFTTSSEKYDWLNHIVAVGKSKQIEGKVAYDIFQIL